LNIDLLKSNLINENCLSEIIYFEEIESTNEYAKKNDLPDNTLIVTDRQTKGKGRFSRIWESAPGKDLTFSLIKKINIGIDEVHLINFYTSYIIFDSIRKTYPAHTIKNLFLKWPNDILLNGKKISGILTDVKDLRSESKNFIIGSGINVNSGEFNIDVKNKATSLLNETGIESDSTDLLNNIITDFYCNLDLINNGKKLLSIWKNNTDIIGKEIAFRQFNDEEGKTLKVKDIDADGGLIVTDQDNNKKIFHSGEISLGYSNSYE
jgi:BirA family biotin operon repressor/biotin-[acetyl-CoA-carboxylase] ligase